MQVAMIHGHTRVAGKSQGFLGLPIRDEVINDPIVGPCNRMTTAWHPTPEEIAKIVAGAPVLVMILGTAPPPMLVEVGQPPDEG